MAKSTTTKQQTFDSANFRQINHETYEGIIRFIAGNEFVRENDILVAIGLPGTGKSAGAAEYGRKAMDAAGLTRDDSSFYEFPCASAQPGTILPFPQPQKNMYTLLAPEDLAGLVPGDHLHMSEYTLMGEAVAYELRGFMTPVAGRRTIGRFALPKGILITADGNPPELGGSKRQNISANPADRSRSTMVFLDTPVPTKQSSFLMSDDDFNRMEIGRMGAQWVERAIAMNLHHSMIGFIKRHTEWIYTNPSSAWWEPFCTPRSITQASFYLYAEDPQVRRALLGGKIGDSATAALIQDMRSMAIPDPKDVWDGKEKLPADAALAFQSILSTVQYYVSLDPKPAHTKHFLELSLEWRPELLGACLPMITKRSAEWTKASNFNGERFAVNKVSLEWRKLHWNNSMDADNVF